MRTKIFLTLVGLCFATNFTAKAMDGTIHPAAYRTIKSVNQARITCTEILEGSYAEKYAVVRTVSNLLFSRHRESFDHDAFYTAEINLAMILYNVLRQPYFSTLGPDDLGEVAFSELSERPMIAAAKTIIITKRGHKRPATFFLQAAKPLIRDILIRKKNLVLLKTSVAYRTELFKTYSGKDGETYLRELFHDTGVPWPTSGWCVIQ